MKKVKSTEKVTETKVTPKDTVDIEVKEPEIAQKTDIPQDQATVTKVGTLLKDMRLEKGLKVNDIAKTLCIRKQYLEAIEDSNYSEIPAFPYGVGFIRSYAEFLGLNSENIVNLYKEETSLKSSSDIIIVEPQVKSSMPSGIYILASLVALGLLYVVWHNWNNSSVEEQENVVVEDQNSDNDGMIIVEELNLEQQPEEDAVTNETYNQPIEQISIVEDNYKTPIKTENTEVSMEKEDTSESRKSTEPLVIPEEGVFLEVVEETWIEVKNESKLYLSKVLQAGDSYLLPNDKGLILSVGKRDGVNVYVNGVKTDIAHVGKKMNIDIDGYLAENH